MPKRWRDRGTVELICFKHDLVMGHLILLRYPRCEREWGMRTSCFAIVRVLNTSKSKEDGSGVEPLLRSPQ